MKLSFKPDRTAIVVGSTLGLLLLLVLYWLLHFWFLRQGYVNEIEAIEPRTARLLGVMASSDRLATASGEAGSRLQMLAYGMDRDAASTAAAMQQTIRELMTGAGLSISASQIMPQRAHEGFDRLILDITAEGNIESLEDALASLESMRPLVFVESLRVTPVRQRGRGLPAQAEVDAGDPRMLSARMQLFSLRLRD